MASKVVFCLLTFSVSSPHSSHKDHIKCMSNDVTPCLNFHWLSISLAVKARVLPTWPSYMTFTVTLFPFWSHLLQLSLSLMSSYHGLLSAPQKCQKCTQALGLAVLFAWRAFLTDTHMVRSHSLQVSVTFSVRASLATPPAIIAPLLADISYPSSLPDFSLLHLILSGIVVF